MTARDDVYAVLVLLTELDRTLSPHRSGGDFGGYGVEPGIPPPLPPSGLPWAGTGEVRRSVALTAQEWSARGRGPVASAGGAPGGRGLAPRSVRGRDPRGPTDGPSMAGGPASPPPGRPSREAATPVASTPGTRTLPEVGGGEDGRPGSAPAPAGPGVPEPPADRADPVGHAGDGRLPPPTRRAQPGPRGAAPRPERAIPERANPERANPERAIPERAIPEQATTRAGASAEHDALGIRAERPVSPSAGPGPVPQARTLPDAGARSQGQGATPGGGRPRGEHARGVGAVEPVPLAPGAPESSERPDRLAPPRPDHLPRARRRSRPSTRPRDPSADPAVVDRPGTARRSGRRGVAARRPGARFAETRRGRVQPVAPERPVVDLSAGDLGRTDRSIPSRGERTPPAVPVPSSNVVESWPTRARSHHPAPPRGVQVGRRAVVLSGVEAVRLRRAVTTAYLDRVLRRGP